MRQSFEAALKIFAGSGSELVDLDVPEISYAAMVRNLRTTGGKSLHVMSLVHGGDACGVLAQVVREGVPKRLTGYTVEELRQLGGSHES